jgi:hypothetical protein
MFIISNSRPRNKKPTQIFMGKPTKRTFIWGAALEIRARARSTRKIAVIIGAAILIARTKI